MTNANATYDYIVVGAGSAGCVLTHRLVKAGHKVLLLEAGPGDANPMIHMPGGAAEILKSQSMNWHYYSEPEKHLNNRELFVPRGRLLGGSSNVNGMVCIRGNRWDYDNWASAGNSGWAYDDVLPHFKAIENWCGGSNEYHGSQGELHIAEAPTENILFDRFVAAGQEAGLPPNADFNGAKQEGVGRYHANVYGGKRWGASKAFIHPIKKFPNFTLKCHAHVLKILFEGTRTTGVEVDIKGKQQTFQANKEVILCSGTINNPQLLMLSGIGDAKTLLALGRKAHHRLPGVGKNLQDHLAVYMRYGCSLPITMNGIANSLFKQAQTAFQYFAFKKGVAAGNQVEAGGFWYSKEGVAVPDIQLHFIPAMMNGLIGDLPKEHGVSVRGCNLRPYSRGEVRLKSLNPYDKPEIAFNFLEDERDVEVLVAAYKLINQIMGADAWQGILSAEKYSPNTNPSNAEIIDFIREHAETDYHPVGTCKMGDDDQAVVDHELRVLGIEGLRVADVSIIPTQISGNTNVPAMMIADKAARMILDNR